MKIARDKSGHRVASLMKHLRIPQDVARGAYRSFANVWEEVPYVRTDSVQAILDFLPKEQVKDVTPEKYIDNSLDQRTRDIGVFQESLSQMMLVVYETSTSPIVLYVPFVSVPPVSSLDILLQFGECHAEPGRSICLFLSEKQILRLRLRMTLWQVSTRVGDRWQGNDCNDLAFTGPEAIIHIVSHTRAASTARNF